MPGNSRRKTGTIRHASGLHVRRIGASLRLLPVIPLPVLFAARAREGERHKPAARVSRDRNSSPTPKVNRDRLHVGSSIHPMVVGWVMRASSNTTNEAGLRLQPDPGLKNGAKAPTPAEKTEQIPARGEAAVAERAKDEAKVKKGTKGDPNPVGRTPTCSVALVSHPRVAHTGLTANTLTSRNKRRAS